MSMDGWLSCRIFLSKLSPDIPFIYPLYLVLNSHPSINQSHTNQNLKKLSPYELILKVINLLDTKLYILFVKCIQFIDFFLAHLEPGQLSKTQLIHIVDLLIDNINQLPKILNEKETVCTASVLTLFHHLMNGYQRHGEEPHLNFYHFGIVLSNKKDLHWKLKSLESSIYQKLFNLSYLVTGLDCRWPVLSQWNRDHEVTQPDLGILSQFVNQRERLEYTSTLESQLEHLINQSAPVTEIKDWIHSHRHTFQDYSLLPFIIKKIRAILTKSKHELDFMPESNTDPTLNSVSSTSVSIKTPEKLNFLHGALELGDQLYWLVAIENITLGQLVKELHDLVFPPAFSLSPPLTKDNLILWWIVQLFYIDYIADSVMPQDFQGDQAIFTQMVALYNPNQVLSKEGCYLRDLALQCAMALQSGNIPDRSGLKRKHPTLIAAIPYSQVCSSIQSYFNSNFKMKSTNPNLFINVSQQDLHKISITSLSRKSMVPITMYVSLVPNHHFEFLGAGFLEAKFLKGNGISSDTIDLMNIGAKQELLSLIYNMMLDLQKGPCLPQGRSKDITCVSPYVLDAVFKLVYNVPHSVELILEKMLQSLKDCDQSLNSPQYGPQLISLTWRHTVLQLLTHRLLRYLKNIKFPSLIPTCIQNELRMETHFQLYSEIESFAIGALSIHNQLQHLEHFLPLHQSTPLCWFETNSMLARIAVMKLARTINTIGLSKSNFSLVPAFLTNLHRYQVHFSERTLRFFPSIMQTFFLDQSLSKPNAPGLTDIIAFVDQGAHIFSNFTQPNSNSIATLASMFSHSNTKEFFLPTLWKATWGDQNFKAEQWELIRPILVSFGPSFKYDNTCTLVWYILLHHKDDEDPTAACKRVAQWIFDYQLISLHHVIFTLACHHSVTNNDPSLQKSRWDLTRYLLFSCDHLIDRYKFWSELDVSNRIWREDDFHTKYQTYLDKYPEFFEYEQFWYENKPPSKNFSPTLVPSIQIRLPQYYSHDLVRLIQCLEPIFSGWIEHAQVALLVRFLSTYPKLIRMHPMGLGLVLDTIRYFSGCEWFHSSAVRQMIQALDPTDYPLNSTFRDYIWSDTQPDLNTYSVHYFERCLDRVVDSFNPGNNFFDQDDHLPPRQYREVSNPVLLAVHLSQLEILGCPLPADQKVAKLLELVFIQPSSNASNPPKRKWPVNVHTLAIIIAGLPSQEFVIPILNHLPHVLQMGDMCMMGPLKEQHYSCDPDFQLKFAIDILHKQDANFKWPFKALENRSQLPVQDEFLIQTLFTPHAIATSNFNITSITNYLTLFHSLIHYSNYFILNQCIATLNNVHTLIFTDRQLAFICSLLGPLLPRLNSDPIGLEMAMISLASCIDHFVSINPTLKGTTPAIELVIGFLHHVKHHELKDVMQASNSLNPMHPTPAIQFLKFQAQVQQIQLKCQLNGVRSELVQALIDLI